MPGGRHWSQISDGEELVLAEGIENALSAALFCPGMRVAASGFNGNLPALELPPGIRKVLFCRDRDGENRPVLRNLERAAERWLSEGRAVEFIEPPAPFKDLNDWLQARNARAAA
jgi:hypothetical protein